MAFIEAKDIFFSYKNRTGTFNALCGLSLSIEKGSFVAVVGSNGSGKSTFSKLLNRLEKPSSGSLFIDGLDASDEKNTIEIRKTVGLVFQNPDNQIVGDTVEEDVAFGPENLGLSSKEIEERVSASLKALSIEEIRFQNPHRLSGGQKQKVAIASELAVSNKCIVLDEATSMLDPNEREEVIECLRRLNREKNTTVILITHHIEECLNTDKVVVMDKGRAVLTGAPLEVFSNQNKLDEIGLEVPLTVRISHKLGLPTAVSSKQLFEFIKEAKKC